MPIETNDQPPTRPSDVSVGAAVLSEARQTLAGAMKKIEHCLDQLRDEDVWWRQHESHNSVQNSLLHLRGNVRQWVVHGVGGAPDVRRIQGFEATVLAAIFDSVSHFAGHTHQIVYIARLRLGGAYRFQWEPANVEQGA